MAFGVVVSVTLCCICVLVGALVEAASVLTLLAIVPPLGWALLPARAPARAPRREPVIRPAMIAPAPREIPDVDVLVIAMARARAIEHRWGKVPS